MKGSVHGCFREESGLVVVQPRPHSAMQECHQRCYLMTNSALQAPTCIPVKTRLDWNRPSRLYTPVLVTFHGRPICFVSRILVLERGEVQEHSHLMSHTGRDTF